MRLYNRVFPITFAMACAISACNDIDYKPDTPTGSTTIYATIEDEEAKSRTCIDTDTHSDSYYGVMWQNGDKIGVFGEGSTRNACFTSKSAGKTAEFAGDMSCDKPKYAYYPYSADNAGKEPTALHGVLPEEQPYGADGKLTADYKYGEPAVGTTNHFVFAHIFSMLCITVDATGTDIEGEKLESVAITVKDEAGKERAVNGEFTFSAIDGSWSDVKGSTGTICMKMTDSPALEKDKKAMGFVTIMPTVKKNDKLLVEVVTDKHRITFTAICQADFEKEYIYDIPLKLADCKLHGKEYKETEREAFTSFGFFVSDNQGKLPDGSTGRYGAPKFEDVSNYEATIDGSEINLTIPYLYDFKLKPTFAVPEGYKVLVDGEEQTSGGSEQDFSQPVTYTIVSEANADINHSYKVTVKNTGLPVVVIKQSKSGDFSPVRGNVPWDVNKFVDFYIRGKETEWVEDDEFSVYNPDGSVDVALTNCGVRQRGNSTQYMPKKALAIKLTAKQGPFGLPSHKRWVLLANWLDHSMIRNAVAFDIAHAQEDAWGSGAMDQGIPWNVHGKNVELVIDGHHVGNYFLCEQVKIGSKRLNIQDCYEDVKSAYEKDPTKPAPTFENCGYLMEVDEMYDELYKFKTTHDVPFMFKDDLPDDDILAAVQSKIQGIEDKIYAGDFSGAYKDLDINSLIDQWLVWELTMNHEYIDPRSINMFMDGDGKLCAGPIWDFDRATFQNPTKAQAMGNSGDRVKPYDKWIVWSASASNDCVWYPELIKDATFQQAVKARWAVMYPKLQAVVNKIQEYGEALKASYDVNNAMWPTDKKAIDAWKWNFSDWSGDEEIASYEDVIKNFVTVYQARLAGMNTLITSGRFTK